MYYSVCTGIYCICIGIGQASAGIGLHSKYQLQGFHHWILNVLIRILSRKNKNKTGVRNDKPQFSDQKN